MKPDPIALSAEFLKCSGEVVWFVKGKAGWYWRAEPASGDASFGDPVPDLTAESQLGRVVRIARAVYPVRHTIRMSYRSYGVYAAQIVETEHGRALGTSKGPHSLNVALMLAFIKAKGGTVPEGWE